MIRIEREKLEQVLEALKIWEQMYPKSSASAYRAPAITAIEEALAQPEQERCVGCEACIDTACGRDECPKGWPKAAQPEQEPVACVVPHGATMRLEWASVDAAHNAKIGPLYTTPPQRKEPEQEPVAWKLLPREATREMLEAMDECSTEGYDERLYAGHAASVYMAAWDAQQPQPEQYITDAMKVRQAVAQALLDDVYAEELEQPEAKQSGTISITMPAPVAYLCENAVGHKYFRWKKPSSTYKPVALYTTPPQRTWVGLTDEEIEEIHNASIGKNVGVATGLTEAKLKEKNT